MNISRLDYFIALGGFGAGLVIGSLNKGWKIKVPSLGIPKMTRFVYKYLPLKGKDAKTVRESFADIFSEVEPSMKKSMTYDRGLDTNENTNGLIRQYFFKGTDFNKVSLERIKFAQNQLNERIRKDLGWECPKEAFKKLVSALDD